METTVDVLDPNGAIRRTYGVLTAFVDAVVTRVPRQPLAECVEDAMHALLRHAAMNLPVLAFRYATQRVGLRDSTAGVTVAATPASTNVERAKNKSFFIVLLDLGGGRPSAPLDLPAARGGRAQRNAALCPTQQEASLVVQTFPTLLPAVYIAPAPSESRSMRYRPDSSATRYACSTI